jgi:hypothetical protein
MRAAISSIVCVGGNHAMPAVERAHARGNRDELVKAAMVCGDCYEIALLFGPQQVGACIGLAHLYASIGRQDKSHEYAKRGLAILADTRDTPAAKALASGASKIIPADIDEQAERQLRAYLAS